MPSSPLHDPGFWSGDPYPAFVELRAADPVHRYEGVAGSFWVITRHADVLAVSKDPATFCSGKGVLERLPSRLARGVAHLPLVLHP